jgi:hypothetical protein
MLRRDFSEEELGLGLSEAAVRDIIVKEGWLDSLGIPK